MPPASADRPTVLDSPPASSPRPIRRAPPASWSNPPRRSSSLRSAAIIAGSIFLIVVWSARSAHVTPTSSYPVSDIPTLPEGPTTLTVPEAPPGPEASGDPVSSYAAGTSLSPFAALGTRATFPGTPSHDQQAIDDLDSILGSSGLGHIVDAWSYSPVSGAPGAGALRLAVAEYGPGVTRDTVLTQLTNPQGPGLGAPATRTEHKGLPAVVAAVPFGDLAQVEIGVLGEHRAVIAAVVGVSPEARDRFFDSVELVE